MWNESLKFQGQQDIPLSDKGKKQAMKTAQYFANKQIDLVYSSDLKRALQTARIIIEECNKKESISKQLRIFKEKGLREMNFGNWEGLTYNDLKKKYPEIINKWYQDPTNIKPENGEKVKDFQQRIITSIDQIIKKTNDNKDNEECNNILLITHGGSIRMYLAYLLQMPLELYWRIGLKNCSVSIIKFYRKDPVIELLNFTDHLKMGSN